MEQAQVTLLTWTGTTSRDWNTPTNWCPARVPLTSDDVVIPAPPANQPILSTTAVAKSMVVNSGASLGITAAGSLSIDASTANALTNNGTLTNDGNVLIGSVSSVTGIGIQNRGAFSNRTGGRIQIDRTSSDAVQQSGGTFANAAIVRIGSLTTVCGCSAFECRENLFSNNSGGDITINRTGQGVLNFATFTNSATLTVGNSAFSSQDNIYNAGTFTNTVTGEIRG